MTKYKVNNEVSIAHSDNSDFLKAMEMKGVIHSMNDATMVSTPNVNVPAGALTYIRPEAVEVLVAPQTSDRVATAVRNGTWGDEIVNIKVKELLTSTSPDDGEEFDGLLSHVNYSNVQRGAYYYTSGWRVNDRLEASVGKMQENARADAVKSAMLALSVDRNKFFFNGVDYKGLSAPVYGLLNDPALNSYVTASTGASGETTWADKTPEEISNDIADAFATLQTQSQGIAGELLAKGKKLKLLVSPVCDAALKRTNSFGLSAIAKIKENFGDIEVVAIPQFSKANSGADVFYLMIEADGNSVALNSYIEMARAYPIFQRDSVVSQKISACTSGCIVQIPALIARYTGV